MRDSIAAAIAGRHPADVPSTVENRSRQYERRKTTRYNVGTVGIIVPDHRELTGLGLQVMVVDVSLGGVGFRSPAEFISNTSWQMKIGTGPIFLSSRVKIISCRPRRDGTFDVGATFV